MRGASLVLTVAAAFVAGTLMTDPAAGQTVTSISPPVVGQAVGRAAARMRFQGNYDPNKTITDGLAISVTNTYGRPDRTYEFDVAGDGVNIPGATAVVPATNTVGDAGAKLAEVINNDPTTPFWAVHTYGFTSGDMGVNNGWLVLVWKYDNEWRATPTATITLAEANDPNDDIFINSNFLTNYAVQYPTYFQLKGTDLTALTSTSVKLRHDVNTSEVYGTLNIPCKFSNAVTVRIALGTGTGSPPVFPSLGDYDLEINGTVVIDKAVKLVENLLDDPSFRHTASSADQALYHNQRDFLIGPYWQLGKPSPTPDGTRNGSVWRQLLPRIYPFQSEDAQAPNPNVGDCEHGSLEWSTTGDGVHRIWQSVYRNFTAGTPLTLTGLWAGGADQSAMTYGVQLRSGGPDGTIFAETPPGQKLIDAFDWADFAVGGVLPANTDQVTVVFYGDHPGTGKKALHLDELLLRVDNDHPTPPSLTGMTTQNHAAAGTSSVTVTLTGANLTPGQTSVRLEDDIISFGCANWGDLGKFLSIPIEQYEKARAFANYQWRSGDILTLTGGTGVIPGQYTIVRRVDEGTIEVAEDINGGPDVVDITNLTVAGYITHPAIPATNVSASGSQVTATFDLTGATPGQRNIVVEVANNLPVIWRDGFNIVYPGPTLTNGSFELPEATTGCGASPRNETYVPASDWHIRHWNGYLDEINVSPILAFRDDHWQAGLYDLPSCPAPALGTHYSSTAVYNSTGTAQYSQTVTAEAGKTYTLSGFFGHSDLSTVRFALLDGDSAAAPMTGASIEVLPSGSFQDWTFAHVTGTATGSTMTAAWEVENTGTSGTYSPKAAWADHLVLEECTQSVTVTSVNPYAIANDTAGPVALTITGSGFSGGTPEVLLTRIGQTLVPTSVAVLNDTTITCQVTGWPTESTQAFEVVVRSNGCIGSLPNGFVSAQTTIVNEQFEDPYADLHCDPRTPNTDPVRYWNFTDQLIREGDVYPPAECPLTSCNCPDPMTGCAGGHYASMSTGEGEVEQAWQTLKVTPGSKCIFGGWFSWDGSGTVNIKLLDGYGLNGSVLGTLAVPHAPTGNDQWCYSSVEGYAIGQLVTVVWELTDTSNGSPAAVHADYMTFETTICHNPFADVDNDGDVDQEDFAIFQVCYTGPGNTLIPAEPTYCACLDVDGPSGVPDGDIDQGDLTLFENCASGPGVAADPACDD